MHTLFPPLFTNLSPISPFPCGIILVTTIFNSGYVENLDPFTLLVFAKLSASIGFNRVFSEILTKKNNNK